MSSRRHDCGQAAVVTVLFLVVLLGMAAAVLDVGSWYREDRKLQATMDAAALAAAQALPDDPGAADALAQTPAQPRPAPPTTLTSVSAIRSAAPVACIAVGFMNNAALNITHRRSRRRSAP